MPTMFIRRLRSTRQAHNSMAILRKGEGRINKPTRIDSNEQSTDLYCSHHQQIMQQMGGGIGKGACRPQNLELPRKAP